MRKEEIIYELRKKGFKSWKKKSGSVNTHFHNQDINGYMVYIYLSNKVRVFVETCGDGSYFITMEEKSFSFKELKNCNEIENYFNKLKGALILFNDALAE